jgi:hypothetical protein
MSDTPETDAFFAEWTRKDGVLARSRLHAEKLERERDEVLKDLEFRRDLYKVQEGYLEEAREKAERYRMEANSFMMQRDEALHKLELCMAANSDVARIARERDEARGQNAKLRDIAERAITAVALWAGSRTNSASKLRAELEQLKEGAK